MAMKRRNHSIPELNMTSTADISFMLLIFFLVAASMDADKGIARLLPPADQQEQPETQVEQDKLIALTIGADNTLQLNGQPVAMNELRGRVEQLVSTIGTDHLITVDADPQAHYNTYFEMQNEIARAYRDVRAEVARRQFGLDYAKLTEEQRESVRQQCPQRIAEINKNNDGQW